MSNTIDIATKLIKLNEGLRLDVYTCPAGFKTFGHGTNLEVLNGLYKCANLEVLNGLYKCAGRPDLDIDFSKGLDKATEQINNCKDKEALAVAFLQSEIINCKRALNTQIWFADNLSEFQQAIILDLAYNIGVGGVLLFNNMIKAIKQRNYRIAGEEMLDSKYHYQMICFGYEDELADAKIDTKNKEDVIEWYNNLKQDYKQLRSMSNALSLQFDKPLGKYKELCNEN